MSSSSLWSDLFDDVVGDRVDLLIRQDTRERGHCAAAVPDLFLDQSQMPGDGGLLQIRANMTAGAQRAVTGLAVVTEQLGPACERAATGRRRGRGGRRRRRRDRGVVAAAAAGAREP